MEIAVQKNSRQMISDVKSILSDIVMKITWREVAHDYFGKSSSWLYHKMDGKDGNGKPGGFTQEELLQLKGALCDLSEKIRKAADRL